MKHCLVTLFVAMILISCNDQKKEEPPIELKKGITKKDFGKVDGKDVFLYTLTNSKGNQVTITNYGGIVTSWIAPDKNGSKSSIVIGFDSLQPYLRKPPYFGALIGRYGNRIAKGKFRIDSTEYNLPTNDNLNHLHGGNKGFDKVVWDAQVLNDSIPEIALHYVSNDGEEGYPGTLKVDVVYTFTDDDELKIDYSAATDKPTVVNLTHHSYFNLTGDAATHSILDHKLWISGNSYTPVNAELIPTGEVLSVTNTPFDFTTAQTIGARIKDVPGGYDHNWVVISNQMYMQKVAELSDTLSGRKLEVFSIEPGLQFYSGNFLDGAFKDKNGKPYNKYAALCLETQHYPNSPNQPSFPSTILRPGEKYHTATTYKLSVQ